MKLLHPSALTGLLFTIFPLLIHLLSRKKYRKWESSLFYVVKKELKKHLTLQKIKEAASLMAKILSIVLISLGASSPITGQSAFRGKIFLDTSPSMELMKDELLEVLGKLPVETRNQIYDMITGKKALAENLTLSSRPLKPSDILRLPGSSIVIGDGRYGEKLARTLEEKGVILVLPGKPSERFRNFSLESIETSPPVAYPDNELDIKVKVKSNSNSQESMFLEAYMGKNKVFVSAFTLRPGNNIIRFTIEIPEIEESLAPGLSLIKIKIKGDDYSYDNTLIYPIAYCKKIKVFSENSIIQKFVEASPFLESSNQEESQIKIIENPTPAPWSITFVPSSEDPRKQIVLKNAKFTKDAPICLKKLKNSLTELSFKNCEVSPRNAKVIARTEDGLPAIIEGKNYFFMCFSLSKSFLNNPEALAMLHLLIEELFAKKVMRNVFTGESGKKLKINGIPLESEILRIEDGAKFPINYDENTITLLPATGVFRIKDSEGESIIFSNYNRAELMKVNKKLKFIPLKKITPPKNLSRELLIAGAITGLLSVLLF